MTMQEITRYLDNKIDENENIVIITLLLIGTAFGAIGSFLSIKKHLQV